MRTSNMKTVSQEAAGGPGEDVVPRTWTLEEHPAHTH